MKLNQATKTYKQQFQRLVHQELQSSIHPIFQTQSTIEYQLERIVNRQQTVTSRVFHSTRVYIARIYLRALPIAPI